VGLPHVPEERAVFFSSSRLILRPASDRWHASRNAPEAPESPFERGISSRTGIFGLGRTRQIPSSRSGFHFARGQRAGKAPSSEYAHAIRMRLKIGRKITLAAMKSIAARKPGGGRPDRNASRAETDTHVEVDLPLGVNAHFQAISAWQVFTSARQPTSSAASIAVFFAMVAVMIGFYGLAHDLGSLCAQKLADRLCPHLSKPVARRVFSSPDGCGRGRLVHFRAGAS